ncbi:MAG TPA: DUF2381 family protein [Archangium sp.]|uniref:DUF2381 family protein n=1 Tax=Archangium sp. TaxID=1872627 RepID=UPI002E305BDF|nr:DUF2381 family protein [Archangium sp.]HEX5750793.1 DUF2381 family protein [Archangium sp.]
MLLASAAALLLRSSLSQAAVRRPYPESCDEPARSIELLAESAREPLEVCISAELSTTFVFDSGVARVEMEDAERFQRVAMDKGTLVLVPRRKPRNGKSSRLTVFFEGDTAPASVAFMLVVHPARLAREVDVFRFGRPEEPWERELREVREENERLVQTLKQLQAEYQGQGPLTGLFARGRMEIGTQEIVFNDLSKSITKNPANALDVEAVFAYRYTTAVPDGEEPLVQVAVVLKLRNPGAHPWTAARAALVREGEEVKQPGVWQAHPLAPLGRGFVVAETELLERAAREKLTLRLWDEGGAQSVEIGSVSFH